MLCFNGTNCYSANLYFDVNQPLLKVYLNSQTWFFQGALHTYSGQGTYVSTGSSVTLTINYTDNFTDTLGNNVMMNRSETYVK